jgi:MFS family permease
MWLFMAVVVYGLATGSFGPPVASMVLGLATLETRGDISGKYYFSIGFAIFVGPLLTSILMWFLNYRQLFLIVLLFPTSVLVAIARLQRSHGLKSKNPEMTYQETVLKPKTARQLLALLRKRSVIVINAITLLFFICEGFFRTLFPVYGQEVLLFSPSVISILFTFLGGVNALMRIPSGTFSDTIGRKKPLLLSMGLCIIAFTMFAHTKQFFFLALGMLTYGVAWGIRVPPSSALLADCVQPHELSFAIACLWMSGDLGFSIGTALAGPLGSILPFPLIIQSTIIIFVVSIMLTLIGFREMH